MADEIVTLNVPKLDLEAKAIQAGLNTNTGGSDIQTDAAVTRKERIARLEGRDLQSVGSSWLDPSKEDKLDNGKGNTSWDQFEVNKSKFNVSSGFDENIYTKKLDKTQLSKEQIHFAERMAKEIETTATTNLHQQEERGQLAGADFDEEEMYSGVIRTADTNNSHGNSGTKASPKKGRKNNSNVSTGTGAADEGPWKRGANVRGSSTFASSAKGNASSADALETAGSVAISRPPGFSNPAPAAAGVTNDNAWKNRPDILAVASTPAGVVTAIPATSTNADPDQKAGANTSTTAAVPEHKAGGANTSAASAVPEQGADANTSTTSTSVTPTTEPPREGTQAAQSIKDDNAKGTPSATSTSACSPSDVPKKSEKKLNASAKEFVFNKPDKPMSQVGRPYPMAGPQGMLPMQNMGVMPVHMGNGAGYFMPSHSGPGGPGMMPIQPYGEHPSQFMYSGVPINGDHANIQHMQQTPHYYQSPPHGHGSALATGSGLPQSPGGPPVGAETTSPNQGIANAESKSKINPNSIPNPVQSGSPAVRPSGVISKTTDTPPQRNSNQKPSPNQGPAVGGQTPPTALPPAYNDTHQQGQYDQYATQSPVQHPGQQQGYPSPMNMQQPGQPRYQNGYEMYSQNLNMPPQMVHGGGPGPGYNMGMHVHQQFPPQQHQHRNFHPHMGGGYPQQQPQYSQRSNYSNKGYSYGPHMNPHGPGPHHPHAPYQGPGGPGADLNMHPPPPVSMGDGAHPPSSASRSTNHNSNTKQAMRQPPKLVSVGGSATATRNAGPHFLAAGNKTEGTESNSIPTSAPIATTEVSASPNTTAAGAGGITKGKSKQRSASTASVEEVGNTGSPSPVTADVRRAKSPKNKVDGTGSGIPTSGSADSLIDGSTKSSKKHTPPPKKASTNAGKGPKKSPSPSNDV